MSPSPHTGQVWGSLSDIAGHRQRKERLPLDRSYFQDDMSFKAGLNHNKASKYTYSLPKSTTLTPGGNLSAIKCATFLTPAAKYSETLCLLGLKDVVKNNAPVVGTKAF